MLTTTKTHAQTYGSDDTERQAGALRIATFVLDRAAALEGVGRPLLVQRSLDATTPAGDTPAYLPPLVAALAGTDHDELPLFGRLAA